MFRKIVSLLFLLSAIGFVNAQEDTENSVGLRRVAKDGRTVLDQYRAKSVLGVLGALLPNYHFNKLALNDDLSKKAFEQYIKLLDRNKRIFLEEDILSLKKYELEIDNEIMHGFSALNREASQIREQRIKENNQLILELLKEPFDIQKEGELVIDPDQAPWLKNQEEKKQLWRKLIQQDLVSQYLALLLEQHQKKDGDKEKVDQKDKKDKEDGIDVDYAALKKLPVDAKLLTEAKEKVQKLYDIRFKRLGEDSEINIFNAYVNAFCLVYGPHTAYHLPMEKENIDIDLTGQLEGIGASLSDNGEEIKVEKIIPGSASWKIKEDKGEENALNVGDIILKVAQGAEVAVDVQGMSINDAVRLIRGKKGTEVRLTIKKPDGRVILVPIIRDKVVIEDSYAKSMVVDDKETGLRIGYLLLPSFYLKQNGEGEGRSSSTDVKKELLRLKEQKVDGIVFDLRGNGGGSLSDVVDMSGYFIPQGPIVQVKGLNNSRKILNDEDPTMVYDGPLVVMISNMSASASEIFAAAMQDYQRGVVLGAGQHSFGKGTVQTFYPLQEATQEKDVNIGSLRFTIQKFYRINGMTTQFKGVEPDITLPFEYMYAEMGEQYLDHALPSDVYLPTKYEAYPKVKNLEMLRLKSKARIEKSAYFKKVVNFAEYLKSRKEDKVEQIALNQRIAYLESLQGLAKELKELKKANREMEITPLIPSELLDGTKASMQESMKTMKEALLKDFYFYEAANILKDMRE